jgi:GntR family transcriptional regulator, transcriptional repressor for pyruvate dehydrogenase complex
VNPDFSEGPGRARARTAAPASPQLTTPQQADGESFDPIHRARVYEEVAHRLQALILDGKLKPGDRLPPERELVRRFHVSRGSVRDAIRTLEDIGLVRSRQGGGTAVCELSANSLIVPLSSALVRKSDLVSELLDVRRMLEPPLAARAALNASDEEIAHLQDVLRRQRRKVRRGELTVEEDSDFHYSIALAARNGVVRKVVDLLMDLLRESRARSLQVEGRLERSLAGHCLIVLAIQRHDPRAAEEAMQLHLQQISDLVLAAP